MSRRSRWFLAAAAALTAGLGVVRDARAEDTSDLESLLDEHVITTASKEAETSSVAPATTSILTSEDLRRYGIHSIDEALDFLSLGVVTADPLTSKDVGARGVLLPGDQGSHLLLLVDGHAVNDPLFGAARFDRGAGIPLELIDHIEVILGPGSVLYGSNAMLGVINVITKPAKDFRGVHAVAEGELGGMARQTTTLSQYRLGVGACVEFTMPLTGAPSELTVMFDYVKQRGPAFDVPLERTGIDQVSGLPTRFHRGGAPDSIYGGRVSNAFYSEVPSALLRVTSGAFELDVHLSSYKRGTPYLSFASEADFDDRDSNELDRSVHVDLRHKKALSKITQLVSRLYADGFDYQRNTDTSQATLCLFTGTQTCRQHEAGRARWAGIEEQASFDWLADGRLISLLGVDLRALAVAHKRDTLDYDTGEFLSSSTDVIHRRSVILGAYVQQTWQPTPWLALNGGARLDAYERFAPVLSPRVAVSVSPWKDGTLKAIFAEAFRAPTWSETDLAGATQLRADDLRPERVRSVEASIEQKFAAQRLLFGVFRSRWSDLVENHFLSPTEVAAAQRDGRLGLLQNTDIRQFQNIASIENYGLNASFDGAVHQGSISYGVNATAAYARKTTETGALQPLVVAPQLFGNAHAAWDLPGLWPTVGLAAHYIGRRVVDRAYGGFHPTPQTPAQVELRATLSGAVPGVPAVLYRLSVHYAFSDVTPYVAGIFQRAPADGSNSDPVVLAPIDRLRIMAGLQWDLFGQGGR